MTSKCGFAQRNDEIQLLLPILSGMASITARIREAKNPANSHRAFYSVYWLEFVLFRFEFTVSHSILFWECLDKFSSSWSIGGVIMNRGRRKYTELREENEWLTAENASLREALDPFAELANAADLAWLAGEDGVIIGIGKRWVTVADLRRAKATLEKSESQDRRSIQQSNEKDGGKFIRLRRRKQQKADVDADATQLELFGNL